MSPEQEQVLHEQVASEQRVIAEVEDEAGALAATAIVAIDDRIRLQRGEQLPPGHRPLKLAEIQAALREQIKCAECGKTRVVLNLAGYRRPFRAERVTAETHCACPPRVECGGARIAGGPAWELVSIECEHCDRGEVVETFDGYPEKSICGMCNGVGRVPLPNVRVRGSSTFEVIDRVHDLSHGIFDTLDEARGCVAFDRLRDYEIWQGDHIVEEPSQERAS